MSDTPCKKKQGYIILYGALDNNTGEKKKEKKSKYQLLFIQEVNPGKLSYNITDICPCDNCQRPLLPRPIPVKGNRHRSTPGTDHCPHGGGKDLVEGERKGKDVTPSGGVKLVKVYKGEDD